MKKSILTLFALTLTIAGQAFAMDVSTCQENLARVDALQDWQVTVVSVVSHRDEEVAKVELAAEDGYCDYEIVTDSSCSRVERYTLMDIEGAASERCHQNGPTD